jgi:hypothetical protein
MSINKLFHTPIDSSKKKLSASELISEKRNKSIFNELHINKTQFNSSNPIKLDGNTYNKNTIMDLTCDISGGNVQYVDNYSLKQSIKYGRQLNKC